MSTSIAAKSGFVIDLREYEQLASEYIRERFSPELQLSEQLRLSDFIAWLRKRTEGEFRQRERRSGAVVHFNCNHEIVSGKKLEACPNCYPEQRERQSVAGSHEINP